MRRGFNRAGLRAVLEEETYLTVGVMQILHLMLYSPSAPSVLSLPVLCRLNHHFAYFWMFVLWELFSEMITCSIKMYTLVLSHTIVLLASTSDSLVLVHPTITVFVHLVALWCYLSLLISLCWFLTNNTKCHANAQHEFYVHRKLEANVIFNGFLWSFQTCSTLCPPPSVGLEKPLV
jgi:hypothetical protein